MPSSHLLEYIHYRQIMTDIEQNSGNYVPPVLMAFVIVHYRQGKTEDAIFWFNAGRLRAQFNAVRCTDISARSRTRPHPKNAQGTY